jgi:hypothetical protein
VAQLQWKGEWLVPKNPSQASRREAGERFDGFPVDLTIFDSPERSSYWESVLAIFEFKAPDKKMGRSQLETYLSLEPRAKLGYWTNGTDSLALYRRANGTFLEVDNPALPRPTDNFEQPSERPPCVGRHARGR